MTIKTLIAAVGMIALLNTGFAYAQSTAPSGKPAAAAKAKAPRSAKSIECSKEADAKGLHGKERQKFRSKCKKS
jgi:hypothetical protein